MLEDRRLLAVDFGDAPDTSLGTGPGNYNTLSTDNGAQHTIVVGLRMGANVDGDGGALQNTAANADDVNGALPDDEDGLLNPGADLVLTVGAQPKLNLRVTNTTGVAATLYGWIDVNGNGVFENATERASVAVPTGTNNLIKTLTLPTVPGGFTGTTYARFRLSTDTSAANPTGAVADGEVEDYRVTITKPSSGLVESTKTRKIASGTNNGPTLLNSDYFGRSVTAIGDIDGDSVTDLAVGAIGDDTDGNARGAVHVLLMNANGTVKTRQKLTGSNFSHNANGDYFGSSLASLGDLDGDGIPDLAVGSERNDYGGGSNRGGLHIVFLNANGTLKNSSDLFHGDLPARADGDYFGHSVASIGDLDGDGVTDVAVGAYGDNTGGSDRGAIHVLFLNPNGTVKSSQKIASGIGGAPPLANSDKFGSSVTSLGDLDGDGVRDLAVGAIYDDAGGTNRGAVHVLFMNSNGTVKGSQKIASGTGGGPTLVDGDQFGASVAAVGDLDGDGVTDLAVGANYDDTGGTSRGAFYLLFMNANGTVKANQKIASGTSGGPTLANDDRFGISIASMGDLDGDGLTDLAVGANFDDTGGINRGAVYTLFLRGPVNTNPVFTSPVATSVPENTTAVMTVTATDTDAPPQTVTFSIVGGADQARFSITGGGALSFASAPDFEMPNDANGDNVYVVNVQASDGAGGTATQSISITVTPLNDINPVFTSPSSVSVPENATSVVTVMATDADVPPQTVTFSLVGGADQSKFSISSGGALTFNSAPDYEAPMDANGDNVYVVTVQASDGAGGTATQSINVTVTPVNEGPVFTSPATASVVENSTAVMTLMATDLDAQPQMSVIINAVKSPSSFAGHSLWTLTAVSNAGEPILGFNFAGDPDNNDPATGLGFFGAMNQVNPVGSPTIYQDANDFFPLISRNVSEDSQFLFRTNQVVPSAAASQEGPNILQATFAFADPKGSSLPFVQLVIPDASAGTVSYRGDVLVGASGAGVNVRVQGVVGSGVSNGLTFSIVGGADQSKFKVTSGGVLTFDSAPDFEAPTDANGDNVYVVTVQADDGTGGTTQQTINVTVTPTNDNNPVFTSPNTASVAENSTSVMSVTATDADLPAQSVSYSLVGGADQAMFSITSGGSLSFVAPPRFALPTDANGDNVYVVTVQASDGAGGTTQQSISVSVTSLSDFGDAPDPTNGTGQGNYSTRLGDNGPSHTIVAGLRMGASVDPNNGTLQNAGANADDVNGALPDDEDGVVDPAGDLVLTVGAQPSVNILVTNTTGAVATLYGWIDYNSDGVFDNATERASIAVPIGTNNLVKTLTFPTVPIGFTGTTYARFRLSTDGVAANPTGSATDGEVEDYRVTITNRSSGLADSAKTKKVGSDTNGGPTLANGSYFGNAVASIGDLDGDGVNDMAVGSIGNDTGGTDRGAIHVLFMNSNGTVKSRQTIASGVGGGPTITNGSWFGRSIASIGDLDGDGTSDLAVGSDLDDTGGTDRGAIYVLFMNPNGTAKASQKIANGIGGGPTLANSDRFGISVTSIGDLDGDGIADLAVGADGDDTGGSERGAAYVLFLNSNGTVKSHQKIASNTAGGPTLANSDRLGRSLTALGDLDGDGIIDLATGAALDDTGGTDRGAVHVLFMNATGTVKASQKIASGVGGGPSLADGDVFGVSTSSVGDLDGDGVTDLAVGAFYDDAGGTNAGAIHVLFLNSDGTVKSSRKIASGVGGGPTFPGDTSFGSSLATLGDLDGDGLVDLAVGAERDDTGGTNRGAVQVLFLKKFNQLPVITSANSVNVAENTTAVLTATATDTDLPPQALTFSIVGGADQSKFGITSGGVLTFNSAPDFELPTDSNFDNVYAVVIQVDDGEGGTATQSISVTVSPVNDNSPLFTSSDSISVVENTTAVSTVTATDADVPSQTVTFSIAGGADQARFAITSGGALSFKTAPNFESPTDANGDNVYVLIVQASDGGLTSLQAILVTVTPFNDNPPVITSPAAVNLPENATLVMNLTATDGDLPTQTLTFSIIGGADQSKFAVTSGGVLTFNSPPDFELPSDAGGNNVYEVTVQVGDGNGLTSSQTINVTITDVFEGDYNSDGTVDAADYAVWRNNVGNVVPAFSNPDGSGNGIVDQDDYKVWKSNFGNTRPMGSGALSTIASTEPAISEQQLEANASPEIVVLSNSKVPVADRSPSVAGFAIDVARPLRKYVPLREKSKGHAIAVYDRALVALLASRLGPPERRSEALEIKSTAGNSLEHGRNSQRTNAFDLALESL